MSKIAWIYPGQGAQCCGMGEDFYKNSLTARQLYDEAGRMLGLDLPALCFRPNEQLNQTEYTQPAMVTTSLAMTKVLLDHGLKPDMTAGLSLGEYAAIAAAGGLEDLDAIRLVRQRGLLMQNTVPAGEGAMAAVLGMEADAIETVLRDFARVTVANYNCPGQIVITGETKEVALATKALQAAGARRVIPLTVSGPFHSPMLETAGEQLEQSLNSVIWKVPAVPYVTNVNAEVVTDIRETKALLKRQISAPVYWMQSMERMIKEGCDTFVEIGPGKTLTGFLRKIDRRVTVYQVNVWEDVEKLCLALQ